MQSDFCSGEVYLRESESPRAYEAHTFLHRQHSHLCEQLTCAKAIP